MNKDLRASLHTAYLNTYYKVSELDLVIRPERRNTSLFKILISKRHKQFVIITAANPGSRRLTISENRSRNARLEKELKKRCLSFEKAIAQARSPGAWPDEHGFMVFDISLNIALRIAVKYGQNAIIFGDIHKSPEIVWTI